MIYYVLGIIVVTLIVICYSIYSVVMCHLAKRKIKRIQNLLDECDLALNKTEAE